MSIISSFLKLPSDSVLKRKLLWAVLISMVGLLSLLHVFDRTVLAYLLPLAVANALVCLMASLMLANKKRGQASWCSAFEIWRCPIDLSLLTVAHSLALVIYGLSVLQADHARFPPMPCLPAVMQLLCCLNEVPIVLQAVPVAASVVMSLVAFPHEFFQPLSLLLMCGSIVYTILTAPHVCSSLPSAPQSSSEILSHMFISRIPSSTANPSCERISGLGWTTTEPSAKRTSKWWPFATPTFGTDSSSATTQVHPFSAGSGVSSTILLKDSVDGVLPKSSYELQLPPPPSIEVGEVSAAEGPVSSASRICQSPLSLCVQGDEAVAYPLMSERPSVVSVSTATAPIIPTRVSSTCYESFPSPAGETSPQQRRLLLGREPDSTAVAITSSAQPRHFMNPLSPGSFNQLGTLHSSMGSSVNGLDAEHDEHAQTHPTPSQALVTLRGPPATYYSRLGVVPPDLSVGVTNEAVLLGRPPKQSDYDQLVQMLETEVAHRKKAEADFAEQGKRLQQAERNRELAQEKFAVKPDSPLFEASLDDTKYIAMKAKYDELVQHVQETKDMKSKYDELKVVFDEQSDVRKKAEYDLVNQAGKTAEMKQKYDAMKSMHDGEMLGREKAAADLADQREQTREMKLKYDHAAEQVLAAEAGKRKADEDLVVQRKEAEDAVKEMEALRAHHREEQAKSAALAKKQVKDSVDMKARFDDLKAVFDSREEAQRLAAIATLDDSGRMAELQKKYDVLKGMYDTELTSKSKADAATLDERAQMRELKRKYNALKESRLVDDESRDSSSEGEALVKVRTSATCDELTAERRNAQEMKSKYDELKVLYDDQSATREKAANDFILQSGKTAEMKRKYDLLKGMHDEQLLAIGRSDAARGEQQQLLRDAERKYDLAQEQLTEAVDGKRKADQQCADQMQQNEALRQDYENWKMKQDTAQKKASHNLAQQVQETKDMKSKYDELKVVFDEQSDVRKKAEYDLVNQAGKTAEMKQKYDAMKSMHDGEMLGREKAAADLADQREQTREMKLKYDHAAEQVLAAEAGKRKADEDLVEEQERSKDFKKRFDDVQSQLSAAHTENLHTERQLSSMTEAHTSLVAQKRKADDDLVLQNQANEKMKSDFDTLKETFDADASKAQHELAEQTAKTRDAQHLVSAMKKKLDKQTQQCSQQQESIAKMENQMKVLRWMLPEDDKPEEIPQPDVEKPLLSLKIGVDNTDAKSEVSTAPTFRDDISYHSSLTNISHDMRTPLTTALSALEILIDPNVILEEFDRQDLLQKAWAALQNVLILVNNLLDFSKINTAGIRAVSKQLNIRRLAVQVLRTLEIQARQGNVELVLDACSSLPSLLQCDRLLLQRVLTNLLANSLKFTQSNGRVILRLNYDIDRGLLLGSVVDTGIGMTKHEQTSLFKEFFQASHGKGGTGLGLVITKQIIREMGGSVSAHSEGKGKGSTFRFDISAPALKRSFDNSVDCSALIIDNDPVRSEALKKMLEYIGIYVIQRPLEDSAASTVDIVFISTMGQPQPWQTIAETWRETNATICLVIPNICTHKCTPENLFDKTLRSPLDISELRSVVRMVVGLSSDTSSRMSTQMMSSVSRGTTSRTDLQPPNNKPSLSTLPEPSVPQAQETDDLPRPPSPNGQLTALLAEDNKVNHTLFLRHLKGAGISDVMSAYNGLEAFELAEKHRFDVIIMDCEMPRRTCSNGWPERTCVFLFFGGPLLRQVCGPIMGGIDSTIRIRTLPHHRHTPIVCMTANQAADNIERCRDCGMNEFFPKPVTPEHWKAIVKIAKRALLSQENQSK